jgi:hypothetical protein
MDLSQLPVVNREGWSLNEKQTVGGRDAAVEPTRMYSRRVCARSDSSATSNWVIAFFMVRQRHNDSPFTTDCAIWVQLIPQLQSGADRMAAEFYCSALGWHSPCIALFDTRSG